MKSLVTIAELEKEVMARRPIKRIRYCVWVRPFLPTRDALGFEGCGLVNVTRSEFIRVARDLLRNLEKRGARIELTIPEEDFDAFII